MELPRVTSLPVPLFPGNTDLTMVPRDGQIVLHPGPALSPPLPSPLDRRRTETPLPGRGPTDLAGLPLRRCSSETVLTEVSPLFYLPRGIFQPLKGIPPARSRKGIHPRIADPAGALPRPRGSPLRAPSRGPKPSPPTGRASRRPSSPHTGSGREAGEQDPPPRRAFGERNARAAPPRGGEPGGGRREKPARTPASPSPVFALGGRKGTPGARRSEAPASEGRGGASSSRWTGFTLRRPRPP